MHGRKKAGTQCLGAVLLAVAGVLSACGGGNGSGEMAAQTPGECEALKGLAGPGAGSAGSHATPQRSDGAVAIASRDGVVVASKLVTIVNDFGGAAQATVDLTTVNGSVVACARDGGGYGLKVMLESRAPTEADARKGLDSMTVGQTDTLSTTLKLETKVDFGSLDSSTTVPVGTTNSEPSKIQRLANIVYGLPPAAAYDIGTNGANGVGRVSGLNGSAADVATTNGEATLNGRWDSATVKTSNGLVSVAGDYASLTASTTNGLAEGDLASSRKLDASFSSTNGSADVKLQGSNAGFDLTASTTNGKARIDVPNTVAVGTQSDTSVHRQSSDYASRAVQAQVKASSTNGNADIHQ